MRFRRAFIVTVVVQTLALVASALFVLLTSRWLGSAGKGLHAVLVSAAQLLSILLGLGLPMSIVPIVAADTRRAPSVLRNQAKLTLVVVAVLFAAAVANRHFDLYPPIFSFELLVGTFVVALLSQAAFSVLLLALGHTWSYNLCLAAPVAFALAFVAIQRAVTGAVDVAGVVLAQTVGTLLGAVVALGVLRRDSRAAPLPDGDPIQIRDQVQVGIKGFLSHIFLQSTFRGDILLIATLTRDLRAAGVYSIAVFIMESALSVPRWAAALLSPLTAADNSKPKRTVNLFWLSIVIMIVELSPIVVFGSTVDHLLTRVLGRGFEGTYVVLLALLPRGVIHSGISILAGDLAGRGYTWFHSAASFAGMVTVFVFDLVLVPHFRLMGAAFASSIGAAVMLAILMRGFLRHGGLAMRDFREYSVELLTRLKLRERRDARNDT